MVLVALPKLLDILLEVPHRMMIGVLADALGILADDALPVLVVLPLMEGAPFVALELAEVLVLPMVLAGRRRILLEMAHGVMVPLRTVLVGMGMRVGVRMRVLMGIGPVVAMRVPVPMVMAVVVRAGELREVDVAKRMVELHLVHFHDDAAGDEVPVDHRVVEERDGAVGHLHGLMEVAQVMGDATHLVH